MSKISIAVDLMGGDHAPQSVSKALVTAALQYPGVNFLAVGLPHVLSQYFATKPANIIPVPVHDNVDMAMSASEASRKGASTSIGKMIELVKEGQAQTGLSAGNTAALMSLAYLILKTKEGIRRPSILSSVEFKGVRTMITDLGANIGCKAEDLVANARAAVSEHTKEDPTVALLNVGTEASKGTPAIKEAAALLTESEINFIGFVEGWDLLRSKADIVVCDGFVGNCVTKFLESIIHELSPYVSDKALLPQVSHAAMLVGLNGLIFKAHGGSTAEDLICAIEEVISHQEALISV